MEALTETHYQGRSCLGFLQGETGYESTSPRPKMRRVQDFSSYLSRVTESSGRFTGEGSAVSSGPPPSKGYFSLHLGLGKGRFKETALRARNESLKLRDRVNYCLKDACLRNLS